MSMKQREITDNENITWTCVQAFAGVGGKAAAEATDAPKAPKAPSPWCAPRAARPNRTPRTSHRLARRNFRRRNPLGILAQRRERGDPVQ
jgi:hypothetical protein